MDLPLRLEFDVTTPMVRNLNRALLESGSFDSQLTGERTRSVRYQLLLAPVWFLAGLGVWRLIESLTDPRDTGGLAFGVILAIIVPGLFILSALQIESARSRALREFDRTTGHGLACTGRVIVEISEHGLLYQDPWTKAEFAWPLVYSTSQFGDHLLLLTLSQRMIIVPLDALPDAVSTNDVIETATRLHESAGGPSAVLLGHLQDNSYRCRGCGYDMIGAKTLECPECARHFRLEDLTAK